MSQMRRLQLLSRLLNPLTSLPLSNLFTGLKTMNVLNMKFSLSPSNFVILASLLICDLISLQPSHSTPSWSVVSLFVGHPPSLLWSHLSLFSIHVTLSLESTSRLFSSATISLSPPGSSFLLYHVSSTAFRLLVCCTLYTILFSLKWCGRTLLE